MERPLPAAGANLREESSWLDVHADQEYVLQVSLRRINLGQQRVSTVLTFLSSHTDVAHESRCMTAHLQEYMSKNGKDSEWLYPNLLAKQLLHLYASTTMNKVKGRYEIQRCKCGAKVFVQP